MYLRQKKKKKNPKQEKDEKKEEELTAHSIARKSFRIRVEIAPKTTVA